MNRAILYAIICRPLTAEKTVNFKPSACGICGEQSGTERLFPAYSRFPLSMLFQRYYIFIHPSRTLQNGIK